MATRARGADAYDLFENFGLDEGRCRPGAAAVHTATDSRDGVALPIAYSVVVAAVVRRWCRAMGLDLALEDSNNRCRIVLVGVWKGEKKGRRKKGGVRQPLRIGSGESGLWGLWAAAGGALPLQVN